MKLFEFDAKVDYFEQDNPLRVATTAALSRIRADIEDNAYKGKFTVDALRQELKKHEVRMTKSQLIELLKQEPWKNLISDIKGDKVLFKGEPSDNEENMELDDTTGTMKKMADRSSKKHADELK